MLKLVQTIYFIRNRAEMSIRQVAGPLTWYEFEFHLILVSSCSTTSILALTDTVSQFLKIKKDITPSYNPSLE